MRIVANVLLSFVVLLSAAGVWAQGLPMARPEQVGLSAERLTRIGDVLQREIDKQKLPGAVALVARRGRVPWSLSRP